MPSPEKLARTGIPKPRAWTFGMRRPRHIGNDDDDVAILVLEDFDPIPLLQEGFEGFGKADFLYNETY